MSHIIRILGLDPALRNTGMSIGDYNTLTGDLQITRVELAQTEKSAVKVVRRSSDDLARATLLVEGIKRICLVHKPTIAVAEVPTGCQSARGAFSNGVCCGVLASVPVPLVEVSPTEVKLASVGTKTASKDAIIQWAVAKWPNAGWHTRKLKGSVVLTSDNEHMADACAAIAAGILTPQFAQAVAMMTAMRAAA